tara:strand:- start:250 stop:420 length:171 start_codon:yes stop_codon:yes gene_type:complete
MNTTKVLDMICWTPLAFFIRKYRVARINKIAKERYDTKKIDNIINQIMANHSDLLS